MQNAPLSLQPVILCGGVGSRLWPLSRVTLPKPFIQLTQGNTLFQQTAQRMAGQGFLPPLVVCAESHRFFVMEQLKAVGITPAAIILEPAPRGTAAAAALAAEWTQANRGATTPMVLLPADHLMPDAEGFRQALHTAAPVTQSHMVLFGITPTGPNTEYGYIQRGMPLSATQPDGACTVARFVEKPNAETAQQLLATGTHVWNSGIFLLTPKQYLAELSAHHSAIFTQTAQAFRAGAAETLQNVPLYRPESRLFTEVPNHPIDTAVMEKTSQAVVFPYKGTWSDVGTWSSYAAVVPPNQGTNLTHGNVLMHNVKNSLIHNTNTDQTTAVVGLENVAVVTTPDAILVTSMAQAADVKHIFNQLQSANARTATENRRTVRPWGWYETITQGPGFLVKKIGVNPGGVLSLQYHHHRCEHWVVVRGTATITKGVETFDLKPDQSTYIPVTVTHRLANHTSEAVEIIEVQTGAILTEDDIVRVEDVYGRTADATAHSKAA